MFVKYELLKLSTKRALLEAAYGVYPKEFETRIKHLIKKETTPKLFAMQALYLYRSDGSKKNIQSLKAYMHKQFNIFDTIPLLHELNNFFIHLSLHQQHKTPDVIQLFKHQQQLNQKIIYSFQRWNRDFPGLAIIQNTDGSFAKDSNNNLLVFRQLARSASNLPYFITNGNSPQGIYSIQGTAVANNHFIGPTPNIQLVMPFEADSIYWHTLYDSSKDAIINYLTLLPSSWQNYSPVTEAFYAGKIGRTEIIAHGTTIDPDYFKGKPYYPLTPTLGCLCAKEIWNVSNGKFLTSDQFNLVNAFLSTPGDTGYLFVINLDNQLRPVSKKEIDNLVKSFEAGK